LNSLLSTPARARPPAAPTPPLSARFIGNRGFSIGIDDVTPAQRLQEAKAQTLDAGWVWAWLLGTCLLGAWLLGRRPVWVHALRPRDSLSSAAPTPLRSTRLGLLIPPLFLIPPYPHPHSYGKCSGFIAQHRKGLIELAPGCNADQSLEAAVTGVLNNIREQAASVSAAASRGRGQPAGW
jgi:hypothetical protein